MFLGYRMLNHFVVMMTLIILGYSLQAYNITVKLFGEYKRNHSQSGIAVYGLVNYLMAGVSG